MIKRPKQITEENVLKVDVSVIAQDRRFDNLKFENAKKKLPMVQRWLVEVQELGAQALLIPNELNNIKNLTNELINFLNRLLTFEMTTTNDNALREHDGLEGQINNFYNNAYGHLIMRILPSLRYQTEKSPDKKELEKQQKLAAQAEQKYKELSEKLENRFQKLDLQEKELEEKKIQIESGHGSLAAVRLAKYFQEEADAYTKQSENWLKIRSRFYRIIVSIIIVIAVIYFCIGWDKISLQIGIAKIIFLSVLWYGLSFSVRNYNINSHLAAVNRYRASVARTLEDFLESNPERKSEMLKNSTEAMFKYIPVGFITKAEKDSGNPLFEIVNKIISSRSSP